MYKTAGEAIDLANGLKRNLYDIEGLEIVICPPYTCLDEVSEIILDSNIKLGAQNMHWKEEGAFTGEVSVLMLKDLGCKYVIIGHSERRQYFGETNEIINEKVKIALKYDLVPILCVGEKLEERKKGKTFDVARDHIENGLKNIEEELNKIVIAYEPVWAIGTGLTATPQQAQEVHAFIRQLLKGMSNEEVAENITIQYGGSVKSDNIADLIRQKDIDGALVGGASLKIESFVEIIRNSLDILKKDGKKCSV